MANPIDELKQIVKRLRAPGGCPWDIEQTPQSITPHIIEEAYELVDAIESENNDNIIDELSDQLLHVVMISEMIHENGGFNFDDVAAHCSNKMIRRHPHVFGDDSAANSGEVIKKWEEIKAKEKPNDSIISDIPNHFPALLHAQKIQKKVAQVGFDWPDLEGPIDKLTEECQELIAAISNEDVDEEIGDILFTIVNICRKLDKSAENLLQNANKKFKSRFETLEMIARTHQTPLKDLNITELEMLWDHAKKLQK